jgi:hypothetical protein
MPRLSSAASAYSTSSGSSGATGNAGETNRPPSTTPNTAAHTVLTSIQPLAATSPPGGTSSVTSPYLAGA